GWGVTLNDAGDADTGPNNLQNFPVITDVAVSNGETTIAGRLDSTPGRSFALDFYANPELHPSGYGDGAVYLGATTVSTDASGGVTFEFRVSSSPTGQFVTATATDTVTGDTSEFSQTKKAS